MSSLVPGYCVTLAVQTHLHVRRKLQMHGVLLFSADR